MRRLVPDRRPRRRPDLVPARPPAAGGAQSLAVGAEYPWAHRDERSRPPIPHPPAGYSRARARGTPRCRDRTVLLRRRRYSRRNAVHRSQSRRTGTRGCACPQPRTGANNGNRSQGIHAARRARRRGVRLRAAGMGAGATLRHERRGVLLRAALGPALGVLGPESEPGLRRHAAEGDRRGQRPARNSRISWCSPAT